jgi:hypothetical protein
MKFVLGSQRLFSITHSAWRIEHSVIKKQKTIFGGLDRQSQFAAQEADDAVSESENGGHEENDSNGAQYLRES